MALTALLFLTAWAVALCGATPRNVLFLMADDLRPEAEPFQTSQRWDTWPQDLKTPGLMVRPARTQEAPCLFAKVTRLACTWHVVCAADRDPFLLSPKVDAFKVQMCTWTQHLVSLTIMLFSIPLQKLASWGTTFQNAYCQYSICGPRSEALFTLWSRA